MSTVGQEAQALERAWRFLLDLGSGTTPVGGHVAELRAQARRVVKHYPLTARARWLAAHRESPGEEADS